MARTIEELDSAVSRLTAEVDLLKQERISWPKLLHQFAGCFTDDADWAAIHEQIEDDRSRADPELAEP